jgi:GNAT superfamily N-acetyltransferase
MGPCPEMPGASAVNANPAAIALRAMTPDDIAGGLDLCHASRWNQLEEDWRFFVDSPRSGAVLAEDGGRVLGTAAWLSHGDLVWIAMMLVDPTRRGSGLGSRLLASALSSLTGASCIGLDATPAGEPLYRRFDFVPGCSLARMKVVVNARRLPPPDGTARPMLGGDLPAVCRHDCDTFGADRSRLLGMLFSRAPEYAWVAGEPPAVHGYCFGRPGYLYPQIGPIVARDGRLARELLTRSLTPFHGREFAMDVPLVDAEWLDFVQSFGFVEERRFLRMFLRGHVHPGIPRRQYAICGPEFG